MTDDPATTAVSSLASTGPIVDWESWSPPPEDELAVEPATPAQTRQEVQRNWDEFLNWQSQHRFAREHVLEGVEKIYSTSEAADFFGRSVQWIYWGLRKDAENGRQVFTYKNGDPILPERYGKMGKRRFTLPIIREIALCCYRRGNLSEDELETIMARILVAEFGKQAFSAVE